MVDPAEPSARSFTTPNGTAPDLWYRVIFLDDAAGQSMPTTPVQNTGSQSAPYATVDDLFRVLSKNNPSAARLTHTLRHNSSASAVRGGESSARSISALISRVAVSRSPCAATT